MAQRLPTTLPPGTRVIHYVDPSTTAELAYPLGPAQLAARQRRERQLYGRWAERQLAIAERDRKVRRFCLGFGAVVGLAVLTALSVLGWLAWTALGLGILAVPLLIGGTAALVIGGHRCITVVQHWH